MGVGRRGPSIWESFPNNPVFFLTAFLLEFNLLSDSVNHNEGRLLKAAICLFLLSSLLTDLAELTVEAVKADSEAGFLH